MRDFILSYVIITILTIMVILPRVVEARRIQYENLYVEQTCSGIIEYRNSDRTRTDCLANGYSIEYDFADKVYQCIGQAFHYARINENLPMCALIIERPYQCRYIRIAQGLVDFIVIDYKDYCQ